MTIEYRVGEFRTSDAALWELLDAISSGDPARVRRVMGAHSYLPPGYQDRPLDEAIRADALDLKPFIAKIRLWWRDGRSAINPPFDMAELAIIDTRADVLGGTRIVSGRVEAVRRVRGGTPWHAIQTLAQRCSVTRQDLDEFARLCPYCDRLLTPKQSAVCGAEDCRREHQRKRTAESRNRL